MIEARINIDSVVFCAFSDSRADNVNDNVIPIDGNDVINLVVCFVVASTASVISPWVLSSWFVIHLSHILQIV